MKLGKEVLLAIIESALFVIGAIFFVYVLITPFTPTWALIVGFSFGIAGAMLWLCPLILKGITKHIKPRHNTVQEISQKIQGSDDDTYELHRPNAYDSLNDDYTNLADKFTKQPEPKTNNSQSINSFMNSFGLNQKSDSSQPDEK